MAKRSESKPAPKRAFKAATVARTSAGKMQKAASLDAQVNNVHDFIKSTFHGPYTLEVIASNRANGRQLGEAMSKAVEEKIKSGTRQVVVIEDLSRLPREFYAAVRLFMIVANKGTRIICIRDGIDTGSAEQEEVK